LITHHILRPTAACSLDWKTNESSQFFFLCVGHSCRGDLVGLIAVWIFLSGSQKLQQRSKKCNELRGVYVEEIPSLVAVACFIPCRAKDLSALPHNKQLL
jgi:hypothetical protein